VSFLKMLARDIFLKCVIFEKKRCLRVIEDEGGVSSLKAGELESITSSVSAGDLTLEAEPPRLRRKASLVLSVSLINILSTSLMLMLERVMGETNNLEFHSQPSVLWSTNIHNKQR
jgi:hypothetical protein